MTAGRVGEGEKGGTVRPPEQHTFAIALGAYPVCLVLFRRVLSASSCLTLSMSAWPPPAYNCPASLVLVGMRFENLQRTCPFGWAACGLETSTLLLPGSPDAALTDVPLRLLRRPRSVYASSPHQTPDRSLVARFAQVAEYCRCRTAK